MSQVKCTNPDVETVKQGRMSFPSGHASNSMSLAWFNSLYIIWALYWREGATYARHVFATPTFLRRVVSEFFYAVIYGFTLLVLCVSWFIGLTRFWDDLHFISDIMGGFLCALIFTTPAFLAAVGQYNVFQEAMDYDEIRRQKGKQTDGFGTAARRRKKGARGHRNTHVGVREGSSDSSTMASGFGTAASRETELPGIANRLPSSSPLSPEEEALRRAREYNAMVAGNAGEGDGEPGAPSRLSAGPADDGATTAMGAAPNGEARVHGWPGPGNGEGHVVVNVGPPR